MHCQRKGRCPICGRCGRSYDTGVRCVTNNCTEKLCERCVRLERLHCALHAHDPNAVYDDGNTPVDEDAKEREEARKRSLFPSTWSPWGDPKKVKMIIDADEIREVALEVNRARRFHCEPRPHVYWTSSWSVE